MAVTDACWVGVEVAVTQQPHEPEEFRVIFERVSPQGKAKLATVFVEGAEEPVVTRFVRTADCSGPGRADFERKAVAVVRNLVDAMAWD